jgi:transposase
MHKSSAVVFLCCGIDVSAAQLVVALEGEGGRGLQRSFPNRATGHQALILWLQKNAIPVRVCLEATGLYSLDLALALHAAEEIEVAVINPKKVNRFAATLCRSKTDPADAQVLAEYARRMPFQRRKLRLWNCAPLRVTSQLSPSSTRRSRIVCTRSRLPPPDRVV